MALLETTDVTVRFGGVTALDAVSIDADAGVVTGLIGPNGAGKTTIFNVITGLQAPDAGAVRIGGEDVTSASPHQRARMGLGRTFQRLEVFGSLTVRENVLVATEIRRRWARDGSNPREVTDDLLDRIGITEVADERADVLPTGLARLVELARCLAARPRLLLLDEPNSGLDQRETDRFAELLLALAGDDLAILMVGHDVDLVMRICRRIHVLDFGRRIASGTPAEIQRDPAVQAAYLGQDAAELGAAR